MRELYIRFSLHKMLYSAKDFINTDLLSNGVGVGVAVHLYLRVINSDHIVRGYMVCGVHHSLVH